MTSVNKARVLSLLSLLSPLSPLPAQDVASVLARAEKAYTSLSSYQADFTQTLENPMLGRPEQSKGMMFLRPPNRFAMRFTQPRGDRIVADGRWLWIYAPTTTPGQVIRQPVPTAGSATPNFFAQFLDRPLQRYTATLVGTEQIGGEPTDVVRLVPRVADLPFREAVIALSRRDSLPRRLSLVEESGQRRVILFERAIRNQKLSDNELRFQPPSGVRIVSPP